VKEVKQNEGDVHSHHHELSVREIDDAHDPHDQCHSYADKRIDAPDENTRNHCLQKYSHIGFLSYPSYLNFMKGGSLFLRVTAGEKAVTLHLHDETRVN